MRTEEFKRGLIFIPLIFALVFYTVFTSTPVLAAAVISYPGHPSQPQNIFDVAQGQTFLLRHRLAWDDEANPGFYLIAIWWDYFADNSYHFTLDSVVAYFDNNGDNLPDPGVALIDNTVGTQDNGTRRSIAVSNAVGDWRLGTFNVDIVLRAAGPDGTPHVGTDNHPIYYTIIQSLEAFPPAVAVPGPVTVRVPSRGVAVAISPSYQSGPPGIMLNYSVTVTNTGSLDDNYALAISDNQNWGLSLSEYWFENVAPGENRTATLSVTMPENAVPCTEDNILVIATSQADNTVSDNDSCTAHAEEVKLRVEVSISPSYQSAPAGTTFSYTVIVRNTGDIVDNYSLTVSDNAGWPLALSENLIENVQTGENRIATLNVTVPEDAVPGTEDNVTVTATSQEDMAVTDSASCIAHVVGAVISYPVGTIDVPQGQTFLLRHRLAWNDPANPGFYLIVIYWDYFGSNAYHFTLESAVTYFDNNGDNLPDPGVALIDNRVEIRDNGTRRSMAVTNAVGDWRLGTFNVDIVLRAAGPDGTTHIPTDNHPIYYTIVQSLETIPPAAVVPGPVTVRVRGRGVVISPNYQSGPPGSTLEYIVTVTNIGEGEDDFDLIVSDSAGWGPTLDDYRFDNIPPRENRQTTLGVIIPENVATCTWDNITVTATSQENSQMSNSASCIAHAAAIEEFIVVIEGKDTAYSLDFTGPPPWVWYENNPPILAAGRAGLGAIVAGGTVSTCRNGRWNVGEWDVFLDIAFQWMVPGASEVLWYEGYSVYNDTILCSDLIAALGNRGYSVTGDDTEPITSSLLSPYDILVVPQFELGNGYMGGDPSLLPDADVDAIVDFVEAGGGLLLMEGTDYFGYNFNRVQNKILRALDFGLIFQNDSVYDDTNNQGAAFEPWCDVDTTTWIGSAYESETGDNEIGLYSVNSLATPPPARFVPPHSDYGLDTDNDNLYNYLVVEVNLSVDTAGWYHVNSGLYFFDGGEWNWITSTSADNYFDVGTQTLELRFNGWHINSSGWDGSYYVYMFLYDNEWNWLDTDDHDTEAYTHDQFELSPAGFAPPHSDYGLDTDNDNLYNYLVVEANVEVDTAGRYMIDSDLWDNEGDWITSAWGENYLDVGTQTLELHFDGRRIERSGSDGPYYVHLYLYDDSWNRLDSDEHETAAYTRNQFQPPPGRFAPPHSDYGLDTDNDNLYNYLVVEANVEVDTAGRYAVSGSLRDNEGNSITSDWADNYLEAGTQTLELRFEGWRIYKSERDGPYDVYMNLYSYEYGWLDSDEHETAAYTHNQFQPPPAKFAPPHSDYGLDTDNDNLYNYLVVEANVEVDTAGWYRVYGSLWDNEGYWITNTQADNYLNVGTQTLELRFEGPEIYKSERDGPYYVYLTLRDNVGNWLDSGEHETEAYTHDQFQPPPPPIATYIKSAPSYEWTPRVSTTDVANGDDVGTWVNLPFEFPFWGEPKTRVWVCSNGFLIFDPSDSIVWTYGSLGDLKERWMIAPFWCDLRTDIGGGIVDEPGIYVDNYADKVVITWEVTRYGDTSDSAKFQVVLYSNGDIRINMDNATNFWDFYYPTLGISRGDGLWYFDITDERETNKSWFFSLIPLANVSVEVSPFVNLGEAGDNLYYEATVTNVGGMADNYTIMVMDNLAWPIAVSEDEISLAPGENTVIVVKVTVPENLTEKVADWITLKALGVSGAENSAEFRAISVIPLEEPPYEIVHPEVVLFLGPGLPTLLVDSPAVPIITAVETGFSMDLTPREPWPILYDKGEFAPVGAAELIGNGRVIALANSILRDAYYDRPELANDEVMSYTVRWLIDWGDPSEHSLLYYVTEDAYHLPPGTVAPVVTKYIEMLEGDLGFEVGTQVGGEITPELIENYDVLQLAELVRPLSAEEIQAIVDFVNDGGGLIVMCGADYGGWNHPWYLNELLEALSSQISFQDDELYDEDSWAVDGPWYPQVYLLDPREANAEFDVWSPPSIEWDASVTATFLGGSDDAVFGVRPDATSGFDNAYDLPEPPPPVAPPFVRTFFYYPEQTLDELNRSCLAPENLMEWPLMVEYAEGIEDITLTWSVEDIPVDYSVLLYMGENLVADMRAEESYTFEASAGSYDFKIVVGKIMPFTLELTQSWNMISFPVLPENSSPDSIFEGYYVLFRWDAANKHYVLHADSGSFIEPDPDVEAGVGYWAYVGEDENVDLLGVPVNQLTLSLRQGWNLIGPPYSGLSIADPADDPDNSVLAWAFTWNAIEKSYRMTQLLEAGKGYWVYAMQDCELRAGMGEVIMIAQENASSSFNCNLGSCSVAQGITPQTTFNATRVGFRFGGTGNGTANISLRSSIDGPILATTGSLNILTNGIFTEGELDAPVTLHSGTTYYLQVDTTVPNTIRFCFAFGNPYPYGIAYSKVSYGWTSNNPPDGDYTFRIYGS